MNTSANGKNNTLKHVLLTIVGLGVAGGLGGLGFMYSGIFNVGATVVDSPLLAWALITTREASIKARAKDIPVPELGGAAQVENGFRVFRAECAMCHTPPGEEATLMAKGLNPQAPVLAELVEDMTDAELYWATKNGIRFTGMPAWASSHDDQMLWDMVAFMRTSPEMSAEEYAALDARLPVEPVQ